jgi:hypothetical protein
MDLSKPTAGDTDWATEVNQNWTDLEDALSFDAGRIPFSDGDTLISSSSLFWDNSNGRLGVGTASPGQRLSLANNSVLEIGVSNAGSGAAGLKLWRTTGSPTLGYEWGYIYCMNDGAVTGGQETLHIQGRNLLLETSAGTAAVAIDSSQNIRLGATGTSIGFLGATAVARQNITGSRGGNAALASLLTALASFGLITDSTT